MKNIREYSTIPKLVVCYLGIGPAKNNESRTAFYKTKGYITNVDIHAKTDVIFCYISFLMFG